MKMAPRDWYEVLLRHNHQVKTLLPDLRIFIHTKYINEENTHKQNKYGQLCNIAEYPLSCRPFEEDFSAKRKLTFDPRYPEERANCNKPSTFINRKFGGSTFPVYMSAEEYTQKCLTSQHYILPNKEDNGGLDIDTIPQEPPYGLYRINDAGQMVLVNQ